MLPTTKGPVDPTVNQQSATATLPAPDFGAGSTFTNAIGASFETTFAGTGSRAGKYFLADMLSSPADQITKEEFDKEYRTPDGPQWVKGMSRARADLMVEDHVNDIMRASEMNPLAHPAAFFAGSLVGQALDPTNYIGVGLASAGARFAKAGGVLGRLGTTMVGASRLINPVAIDVEGQLLTAAARARGRLANTMTAGLTEASLQTAGIRAFSSYTQQEYTNEQMANDAIGAVAITGLMGLGHSIFSHVSRSRKDLISDAVLSETFNGTLNPDRIKALAATDPVAAEILARMQERAASAKKGSLTQEQLFQLQQDAVARGDASPLPKYEDIFMTLERQAERNAALAQSGQTEPLFMTRADRAVREDMYRALFDQIDRTEQAKLRAALIENASQTVEQRKAQGTLTPDESWLADLYKRAFGVEVKFFDEAVSKQAGSLGLFMGKDPKTIYVRSGALFGGADAMMSIAGHEVSHSISKRMPGTWLAMADAIVESGTNPLVRDAYARVKKSLDTGDNVWSSLPAAAKVDELFATVSGLAMQTPEFWRTMWKHSPEEATLLRADLRSRAQSLSALPDAKGHWAKELVRGLGLILAAADHEKNVPARISKELYAKGGYAYYGTRHLDFLNQLHNDMLGREYRSLLGDGVPETGVGKDRRPMTLTELDAHVADIVGTDMALNDRSGTPLTKGQYDLREPWRPRPEVADSPYFKEYAANFILNVMFAKAKPGSKAHEIYQAWKANKNPRKWWESVDVLKRKDAPLVHIFDNKDGTYQVGVLMDDKHPMVEFDRSIDEEISKAMQTAADHDLRDAYGKLQGKLRRFVEEMAKWDPATQEVRTGHLDPLIAEYFHTEVMRELGNEWRRSRPFGPQQPSKFPSTTVLLDQLSSSLVARSHTDNIFNAILHGFSDFLANKAQDALQHMDWETYAYRQSLAEKADVLTKWRTADTPLKDAVGAASDEFQQAWKDFTKRTKLGEEDRRLLDPDLIKRQSDPAVFVKQVEEMRARLTADFWGSIDARVKAIYGDNAHAYSRGLDKVQLDKDIAEIVDGKLRDIFPGLDRSLALKRNLEQKMTSSDSVAMVMDEISLKQHVEDNMLDLHSSDDTSGLDGSFMARLPDESPASALERANNTASEAETRSALNIHQLNKLAAAALDREHRVYNRWNEDYVGQSRLVIKREGERLGLPFDLSRNAAELTTDLAAHGEQGKKLTEAQDRILKRVMELKQSHEYRMIALDKKAKGDATGNSDRLVDALWERNMNRNARDTELAYRDTLSDLERQSAAEQNSYLRDQSAGSFLRRVAHDGAKHLKAMLDGLPYGGVKGSADSVAASRLVARETAQSRIINLLESLNQTIPGFRDLWMSNQLTHSLELHKAGLYNGPEHIRAVLDMIVERLDQLNSSLVGEANALGANIRLHENYLWSHVHRSEKILEAGKDTFIKDLLGSIDRRAMQKLHGPEWDPKTWAEQFFHEVTDQSRKLSSDYDPDVMGNNMADVSGTHRSIVFKPGEAFNYDMKYGSGNTAALIIAQIGHRGEKIGMMRKLGTNFERNWGEFIGSMGGPGPKFHDLWVADNTFRYLAGQLDHPYNANMAVMGRAVRNWMNAAVGWMSGVSSLTDFANLATQVRYMGGTASHGQMLDAMLKHAKSDSKYAEWLRGHGAGLQTLVQGYSRNLEANGWFANTAESLSNLTFKYNGLELMNRSVQGAFFDLSTQILGEAAHSKKLTKEFSNWLSVHDITEPEFRRMAEYANHVDGLDGMRLSPDMIPDINLSRKLQQAMRSSMDYALVQPSASTEAIMRFGTQAGTWSGEAVRTIMQYKSYPVDMVRRITRRFRNGYDGSSVPDRLAWAATMLGLATVVLSIKDMTRGTEPLNPFDSKQWTFGNVSRVVGQAAVGPIALTEQFLGPPALGPAGEGVYNLATADNAYGKAAAFKNVTPFSTFPGATLAFRTVLSKIMPETFGIPIQNMYRLHEAETGQSNIMQK